MNKDRERQILDRAKECRHFTGEFYKVCKAGVAYESVKDEHFDRTDLAPVFRTALPCRTKPGGVDCRTVCEKRDFPTLEEATEMVDEQERRFTERLKLMAENYCPEHKIPITKTQVGRCVYAKECGCRLYQGRI